MIPFLLNPDGSIPNGVDIIQLVEHGLTPVFPTPQPEHREGFNIVETDPVEILGQWFQTWDFEPIAEVPAPALPTLTKPQFSYLLALSGFEDVWTELEAALKTTNVELYAQLKGSKDREAFHFDETIRLIGLFKPFIPAGSPSLTAETLRPLWMLASAF